MRSTRSRSTFVRGAAWRFLLVVSLAAAREAAAQTFTFTSCNGITATVNVTGNLMMQPTMANGPFTTFTFTFSATSSLTGAPSASGLAVMAITYGNGGYGETTTFSIKSPAPQINPPMLGWAVYLSGAGDLLAPGVFPTTLPPLSAWSVPALGSNAMNGDFISLAGNTIPTYYLACSGGSGGGPPPASVADKALGNSSNNPGGCDCGEPINIGSGNLFEQVLDYETVGGNQLSFRRYYNSLPSSTTLASVLGTNWRSNYDRYLRINSTSSVTAERPDGQQINFNLNGNTWSTDTDVDLKLTNSGNTWILTDRNDTVETYGAASTTTVLLHTIQARNGYTQGLEFNAGNQLISVSDSYGRRLTFTYTNGLLETVSTPDGMTLTYGYAAAGSGHLLTSITYPTSPATSQTYVYENSALPAALTAIIDENGNRYTTWTYDSKGRALSSQHAGGADLTKVAYNDADGSRTVTYPLGVQMVYKFTTLQNVPKITEIDRLATATTPAAKMTFSYDGNGYQASQTDWNGNTTNYVNDAHGQPTSIVEAAGTSLARTTTITYHTTFHLPVQILTPGFTTRLTYDNNGELLTRTLTDTTTTISPYSTSGQTRTWTYTYSNFQLASVKTPRTDVNGLTKFTYDSSGAFTAVTNALNQTIQITQHLPGGLPQTRLDSNGVETDLTYDARLRLLTSMVNTAAGALTTSYGYDAAGSLLGIALPDGSALVNRYDTAHRLTGVANLLNEGIVYTLDAAGDRTQTSILDVNGNQQRTRSDNFDALGRLLKDIGAAGQTTAYTYDANDNRVGITDPLGHTTERTFDALNRMIKSTDPAKGVTALVYDTHNRPTSVTDPNGGVTTYVYDGFGDLIQCVSPDSGITTYRYDADGNLTQRVDGAGATVNYTYDALDRVITAAYPADAAENVSYTYDETGNGFSIGRLTTVTDAVGTLNRSYDERGFLLAETRVASGVALVTSYTYDAAGHITSITYPSGWTATYSSDAMGRTAAVTVNSPDGSTSFPVAASVGYQPFGPINALMFGNGVAETRSFDLDYRLANLADYGAGAIQYLTYSYDAANNVSSITDGITSANTQSFAYDSLDRIVNAAGGYGSFTYTYDSVGNRLTENANGSPATFSYTAHSNRLASLNAGGAQQTVGYTQAGNISNFQSANLTYNQAGRLATVTSGGGQTAQYTYDAFGKRLVRTGAMTATTLFQYNSTGQLLEETDGQGIPLVDYLYVNGLPVATLSPATAQIYFLHDDRLGTPQLATDSNQNAIWVASYGPFGEMSTVPSGIVEDLRLPGQEFDVETGLYHNGFRDYVPGWGR
ncbi:MAG TPA: DUF6531 domain-containing protein, partial [Bryobacteraceae bacterium]|nr:DUF6531 domain-containing protein [Bryobacteraceae bacterium]